MVFTFILSKATKAEDTTTAISEGGILFMYLILGIAIKITSYTEPIKTACQLNVLKVFTTSISFSKVSMGEWVKVSPAKSLI